MKKLIGKLAMIALIGAVVVGFSACGNKEESAGASSADNTATVEPMEDMGISDLQKEDLKKGSGDEAKTGDSVKVHYTGWLYDKSAADHKGKKFDSSVDRGQPFEFVLGQGQVIAGWDNGVAGMKVGGERRLIVPPAQGYGDAGAGADIPPNATLVFDVELLSVNNDE